MKKDAALESPDAANGTQPAMPEADRLGKVEVSPEAIANIAANAIVERAYGVVGMASKRLKGGKAETLKPEHYRDGIEVEFEGQRIILNLYVILLYGVRVSEVAHNIMTSVKFEVENHLGREVAEVNVFVQGLHRPEVEGISRRGRREANHN